MLGLSEFLLGQGPIVDQNFVDGAVEKAAGLKSGFALPTDCDGARVVLSRGGVGDGGGVQFGEGDGKDAMTLAGMFLGASLAHDDELAQGPGVLVTKCYTETRYEESVYSKVYSHSTLSFTINGKNYKFDFMK